MLGNVWAELIKSKISLLCSKSFIKQSAFSLENSRSLFVPNESSFENSHGSEQYAPQIIVTFRWKFASFENSIFFCRKAKKSRKFRRNTFALLLHNTISLEGKKISQKEKCHPSSLCKAFSLRNPAHWNTSVEKSGVPRIICAPIKVCRRFRFLLTSQTWTPKRESFSIHSRQ